MFEDVVRFSLDPPEPITPPPPALSQSDDAVVGNTGEKTQQPVSRPTALGGRVLGGGGGHVHSTLVGDLCFVRYPGSMG